MSAAAGVATVASASHDAGVVRVVGLGWTGIFRVLDAIVAAPFMLLPIGTHALRAGLASAVIAGFAGTLAFAVARALVFAVLPNTLSPKLGSSVALATALAAVLAPAWQVEASAPGGAVTGAFLIMAVLALGAMPVRQLVQDARIPVMALVLGLAASYEPLVFVAALGALAPSFVELARQRRPDQDLAVRAGIAFALGLIPLGLGVLFSLRDPDMGLVVKPFAFPLGEGALPNASLPSFVGAEIGTVLLVAAVAGGVLTALNPRTRSLLASLLGVVVTGLLAFLLRAPAGPSHVVAPILSAIVAVHVLAGVALATVVHRIARARVPFAQASAAMAVVLVLVLPARAADEASARREARAFRGEAAWNEAVWGPAPPAAVVLVSEPDTLRRVAAARATGQMRSDLLVVPSFDVRSRRADRALSEEPKLAPLYRDLALGMMPEELSLAQVSAARPLLASFGARWDRKLARHFVPLGLLSRFESEPRAAADRRRGLDDFGPSKERLVRVSVTKRDPELAGATAVLLRERALGVAACGERDVLSHALDDLRPFAPDDATATTLVRRIVTNKGAIDVSDLGP
ncbi:hypothetical protein [Labilithrix luteola]|uniref:hypothetical protein n=1 Tax=Labilithrix luteola TaxID=1391654 RepID=UPI0011BA66BA|nr:hypothetical protein [Labilithrix luteola]